MQYYKRTVKGKIVQLHLFVDLKDYVKSEIFTIDSKYKNDVYFPIDQMSEIELIEFQAIACIYNLLRSSYQQKPQSA